jgi:hypothetical protein
MRVASIPAFGTVLDDQLKVGLDLVPDVHVSLTPPEQITASGRLPWPGSSGTCGAAGAPVILASGQARGYFVTDAAS